METILDRGVGIVLWFQNSSPSLDLPFKIITFMGNEGFFILILPFIYWCVDRRTGVRLSILFLFSGAYVNSAVKVFACQPRPFWQGVSHLDLLPFLLAKSPFVTFLITFILRLHICQDCRKTTKNRGFAKIFPECGLY